MWWCYVYGNLVYCSFCVPSVTCLENFLRTSREKFSDNMPGQGFWRLPGGWFKQMQEVAGERGGYLHGRGGKHDHNLHSPHTSRRKGDQKERVESWMPNNFLPSYQRCEIHYASYGYEKRKKSSYKKSHCFHHSSSVYKSRIRRTFHGTR